MLGAQGEPSGDNFLKMSTALMRDAHFRGLMGFKFGRTTTPNRILDTPLWRHHFGSHFGGILASQNRPRGILGAILGLRGTSGKTEYRTAPVISGPRGLPKDRLRPSDYRLQDWKDWRSVGPGSDTPLSCARRIIKEYWF